MRVYEYTKTAARGSSPLVRFFRCRRLGQTPPARRRLLVRARFSRQQAASGERFNAQAMTAAHESLQFGTKVRVVNEKTGRSVVVRINDRGPYAHGRIIDLAQAPARALGILGTSYVSLHSGG